MSGVSPAEVAAARRRGRRRLAFRVLGSVTILGALLWFLPFDELKDALGRIPPLAWAAALAVYLCLHLLGVTKWHLMVNAAGGGFRFTDAVRCYYYGLFGNTFLPSLVGGDAVRAGLALRLARGKAGLLLGSVLDRMLDVAGLATLAAVGALVIPGALGPEARTIFWWLAGLGALAGVAGVVAILLLPARRFPFRLRRILARLRGAVRELARRPVQVAAAFTLGLGLQAALVCLNAWLGHACGIDIALHAWFFAWPMAKISALIPVTQGGIGIREAALSALLAPFGVAPVLAFAAGLVFQAVILSGGLVGGLIAFLLGRRQGAAPALAGTLA
ncbi:MAG: lysylphosphatidylglycerol synthase transmembrane domain-containing protein [Gemmatimonadota bacterium]|nr:flippase-like domain-containing protein [Gemmatimonadota bacterium]